MRGKIFGRFFSRTLWGFAAAAVLIAAPVPFEAIANEPSPLVNEQKQSEQDRCKFLMDKVNAIILSLDHEGKIRQCYTCHTWRYRSYVTVAPSHDGISRGGVGLGASLGLAARRAREAFVHGASGLG